MWTSPSASLDAAGEGSLHSRSIAPRRTVPQASPPAESRRASFAAMAPLPILAALQQRFVRRRARPTPRRPRRRRCACRGKGQSPSRARLVLPRRCGSRRRTRGRRPASLPGRGPRATRRPSPGFAGCRRLRRGGTAARYRRPGAESRCTCACSDETSAPRADRPALRRVAFRTCRRECAARDSRRSRPRRGCHAKSRCGRRARARCRTPTSPATRRRRCKGAKAHPAPTRSSQTGDTRPGRRRGSRAHERLVRAVGWSHGPRGWARGQWAGL